MRGPRAARLYVLAAIGVLSLAGCREPANPVTWSASLPRNESVAPGSIVRVRIEAKAARGWYVYAVTQPRGGPIPTRIWLADTTLFAPAGPAVGPDPARSFDKTFGISVEKYLRPPSFELPVRVRPTAARGRARIEVNALYQACNDTVCLSPKTVTLAVPIRIE